MLKIFSYVLLCFAVSVKCQALNSRACLVGRDTYITELMQRVIRRIENEVQWCNLKMVDRGQTFDEQLFKWHARGMVNYTNGFVISVGQIDLTNFESMFTSRIVSNVTENTWNIRSRINLHELNIGFDVIANVEDSGHHRFTGAYSHLLIVLQTAFAYNTVNGGITATVSPISVSSGNRRMIYMPHNSITEMLSRSFVANNNRDSFERWGREIFAPLLVEEGKKMDFPTVNFNGRC